MLIRSENTVLAMHIGFYILTVATTESLAAKEIISAQDTTPGHAASSKLLILSMKSYPRTVRLGIANLSV